jgi:hypothetical protein
MISCWEVVSQISNSYSVRMDTCGIMNVLPNRLILQLVTPGCTDGEVEMNGLPREIGRGTLISLKSIQEVNINNFCLLYFNPIGLFRVTKKCDKHKLLP